MNTKQLRQKILDLAIRGKLVPQDPNDEPASVLLERVRAEKEALIKARKTKNEQPLLPITEKEIPFSVPAGWMWCRLNEVCLDFQYGTSQKSDKQGKIAVLRMGNLQNGEVDYSDLAFTSDEADIGKYLLKPNELLFNRTNSPEWVGKTAIYRGEMPAIFAGYIIRIAPVLINPLYLNYLMNSEYHRSICLQAKTDGVNQSNINAQKLSKFIYPLPPLAEQQRIVASIESAFTLIDEIERNKNDLQTAVTAAKKKILSLAICGKLVPQDPNDEPASVLLERIRAERERLIKEGKVKRDKKDSTKLHSDIILHNRNVPFDVPKSWVWARIIDIAILKSGGQYEISNDENSYLYVKVADMNANANLKEINISSLRCICKENELIPPNSIIFPKRGGAILTNKKRLNINSHIAIDSNTMALIPFSSVELCYIKIWLDSFDLSSLWSGNVVPQINNQDIYPLFIPLPPIAEQQRIVTAVEAVFEQLDRIIEMCK